MAEEGGKIRRRQPGRLLVPGLLAGFCVWYGALILELPQGPGEEGPLGPAFAPWLWAALLGTLVLLEAAADFRRTSQTSAPAPVAREDALCAVALCLLLAGFALSMQYVGFTAATVIFLAVCIRWSGVSTWRVILPYAILCAVLMNYVFHRVLRVPLPQDWLF